MKTGGGEQPLVGSSPTASAFWGHGPTGRRHLRKVEIRVRLSVTPLEQHSPVVQRQRHLVHTQETMVRLHPGLLDRPGTPIGRAAWLKPRRMRVRLRPWARPGRQAADHLGLEPGMLWVRVPPGPLETRCPRGAAWSARLPVTQEIAGSNPVEGAFENSGAVRKSAKRPRPPLRGGARTLVMCGFDSRLRHCEQHASAGHRRAQLPVKQPACKAMQVQLLPGALSTWPVRLSA